MFILRTEPILPGFKLSFAITLFSLSIFIILPLIMLVCSILGFGWTSFFSVITSENVLYALFLTLSLSLLAVLANVFLGLIIAWVLVRYDFFGKGFLNAIVDLPFALPTSVTGITLATLYAPNGWLGSLFAPFGIRIAFTNIGIWLALIVVSLPFIVRTIQPVLEELSVEQEEVAATLNTSRFHVFRKVILPELLPALIGGIAIAFARCTGEYGSVIFIAGNIPKESEILPLVIAAKFEQFDITGASAVALLMLIISFSVLLFLNWFQRKAGKGLNL